MITLPPPNRLERFIHGSLQAGLNLERRFEPYFRPFLNRLFREPTARLVQWIMNLRRRDEGFELAEERKLPNEESSLDSIVESFASYMRQNYRPGEYQRGGNTKTHGIVHAEFVIHDDVPEHMRKGVFATPRTFKAWVRFSGPGPDMPDDIDDVGFASCAIKLMGVEGEKLMEDEKHTQDFISSARQPS